MGQSAQRVLFVPHSDLNISDLMVILEYHLNEDIGEQTPTSRSRFLSGYESPSQSTR